MNSTNLQLSAAGVAATPLNTPNLVINANALSAGGVYVFVLTASSPLGASAQATLTVTVSQPPSGGMCVASPSAGLSLTSNFTATCSGWSSVNTPLSYAFSYVTAAGQEVPLSSTAAPFPSLSAFVLPAQGNAAANVTVVAYIIDSTGAVARYPMQPVTVSPAAVGTAASLQLAQQVTAGQLAAAVAAGNAAQVGQIASAVASLLNAQGSLPADQHEAAAIRASLVDSLAQSAASAGLVTATVLAQQVQVLSQVLQSQLPQSAVPQAVTVVSNALAAAAQGSVAIDTTVAQAALSTVSSLLAVNNGTAAAQSAARLVNAIANMGVAQLSSLVCGQPGSTVTASGISTQVQKLFVNSIRSHAVSVANGVSFTLPPNLFAGQSADCYGLQQTQYTQTANPYSFAGVAPLTPVASLSFMAQDGSAMPVTGLSTPINITIALPSVLPSTVAPSCQFWSGSAWSTTGCTTIITGPSSVICQCTHLTDFAVFTVPAPIVPGNYGYVAAIVLPLLLVPPH